MNNPTLPPRRAFTIVELLVVIGIFGILASILLPVIMAAIQRTKIKRCQVEMGLLVQAVQQYRSRYSCYPLSREAMTAETQANEDFTRGTSGLSTAGTVVNPITVGYNANNCEVVAILMALTNFQNGVLTVNRDHLKNPQRIRFLNAKLAGEINRPGVGPDGVYRDP
jgi:prepilin-type N-terminal cleavage/methylation domain-containing protein